MRIKNKFTISFIILLAVFFIAQLFTLGSLRSSGESLEYASGKTVIYNAEIKSGEKLDDIYIKVGSIYADYGAAATVTVKTGTSSSSTATPSTSFGSVSIANVYGEEGRVGANYNWIAVATGKAFSSVKKISLSADKNLELIEIVAFSDKGHRVALTVADNSAFSAESVNKTLDAQDSFLLDNSAKANFTQDEGYTMTAVHTVLGGKKIVEGSEYNLHPDFGVLSTLFVAPSVALFGETTFALRLPSLVATTVVLAFLGLLGTSLFKDEKYGFIFALVFALGGMATSVGRLGAPYAFLAALLLGSLYFMHRFYSKGLSRKAVKGASNILLSGLFASLAIALDATATLPVAGVLVLFGFGLRRQRLVYRLELANAAGKEETRTAEDGTEVTVNPAETKAKRDYSYKLRVSIAFAAIGFIAVAFLVSLITGVIAYGALVKAYDDPASPKLSIITILFKGFVDSGKATSVTEFTSANASNIFSWFLPLKAATLYDGVTQVGSSQYLAWNAAFNPVLSALSLLGLLFATVRVILDFVKKRTDKSALRVRRAYFILLGGLLATLLSALIRGNVSAISSLIFQVFYLGFIPLALLVLRGSEKGKISPSELVFAVLMLGAAAVFALSLPSVYGYAVSSSTAKLFGWTSILSNGYFR